MLPLEMTWKCVVWRRKSAKKKDSSLPYSVLFDNRKIPKPYTPFTSDIFPDSLRPLVSSSYIFCYSIHLDISFQKVFVTCASCFHSRRIMSRSLYKSNQTCFPHYETLPILSPLFRPPFLLLFVRPSFVWPLSLSC